MVIPKANMLAGLYCCYSYRGSMYICMILTPVEEKTLHIIGMSSIDSTNHEHIRRQLFPALRSKHAMLLGLHLLGVGYCAVDIAKLEANFSREELDSISRMLAGIKARIEEHKAENRERDQNIKGYFEPSMAA